MPKAIVIGSGIAGIAAALRLRHKGYAVDVYESNANAGGKIHAINNSGFRFDFGPSLFTMPHLVDELFELFNENPTDYFRYSKKDIVCNYFWSDGFTFSVPANQKEFINQAAKAFNVDKKDLERYLKRNKEKYDLTAGVFLEKSLHKYGTFLNKDTLSSLFQLNKLHLNKTLNGVNEQYFKDEKLVQLFNRYATYNGSSPYSTPGIMSMIPHLEMHYGTFFPDKGMHSISQSLYKLAKDKGVLFHFNQAVESILHEGNQVSGIKTALSTYQADLIVSNADVFTTYENLLPRAKKPNQILKQERSSSAVIFYWGIKKTFPELDLHNILFSSDYKAEFKAIFEKKTISEDPTVYINISSKEEASDAPEGCENWFVMINAPGNFGQNWDEMLTEARKNVILKINEYLGIKVEDLIVSENVIDPRQIEKLTRSHRGSLYGTSSNSKFAAFLRHPNFSGEFNNLFFCGGSAHPGGGIPLCLLSAKIATDQIKAV